MAKQMIIDILNRLNSTYVYNLLTIYLYIYHLPFSWSQLKPSAKKSTPKA